MILDHVITVRGGPVDGKQYRVPIKLTQIVIQEQQMYGAGVDSADTGQVKKVQHLYEAAMVVQGHTIVTEFFYRGVINV